MKELQNQLNKLMSDFNNSAYRLKLELELGGKLKQEEVDYYNHVHSCIMAVRKKIDELSKN